MEIDDWTEVPPAVGTAQAAPADPGDWADQPMIPTDEYSGEAIPLPFSGLSPDTAMNKSVVSLSDRMKMSLGNKEGNLAYLHSKSGPGKDKEFQDVRPIDGSNELAVLKGGTWYRVDPENGEIADPWEKAKEYLKDAADAAPMLATIGATAGASALGAGVASVPAAAATAAAAEGIRTSLGRIVGTYDATPAEQAWDIGFETLLNAGGAKIAAGVKPTAKFVASKLGPLAETFKETAEPWVPNAAKSAAQAVAATPKAMFKKIFASYSVGENNFDTMVENPEQTKAMMHQLHDMSKGSVDAYHDEALRGQLNSIKGIADKGRKVLTDIYGGMQSKILGKVPANFTVNLDTPVFRTYSDAVKAGIGKIAVRTPSTIKLGAKDYITGKQAEEVVEGGIKYLQGNDAIEYMAKNGVKNVKFEMLSKKELAAKIAEGGEISDGLGYLASDADAYGVMKGFYDELGTFAGGKNRSGIEGAKALLNFKKIATNLSYTLANKEVARGTPEVRFLINNARTSMDDAVFQEFNKAGLGKDFVSLNSTYNSLSSQFSPLLQAKNQFEKTGNIKAYEPLLSTFLARPGKNASARFAIDDAIVAADSHGLKGLSKELIDDKLKIQVGEAAKAFNPIKPGVWKADALGTSQAGMMIYAAASGNPALAGAIVGAQVLRSPNTARAAIATVQGLSKGQEFVKNMSKDTANKFLSDPKAMNTFLLGVTQAPIVHQQAEEQLNGIIGQAARGAQ